ncbi:hypothetical protein Rin_00001630 [Candidatus Regiella insecticola 5.15]|uniref:Uncharacterized protein n=1 Tax=Candidatus Regiella insecticola 5.15 TaxID=1005043 RepID=G2GWM7_9ENTR|nr:hypothetical protein [Candidatus Regiella insecticola]EGY29839.1 hypothetical protein Rin_00001630 [Candidatus Regiella insecticola 5.15]
MSITIIKSKNRFSFNSMLVGLLLMMTTAEGAAQASRVNIDANFKPHINNKAFQNLTHIGGNCLNKKSRLSDDGKKLILHLCRIVNTGWIEIQPDNSPKTGLYVAGFSSKLELKNNNSYSFPVPFKVTKFEVKFDKKQGNTVEPGVFSCDVLSDGTPCHKILPLYSFFALKEISITAELTLPDPLTIESGAYFTDQELILDLGETFSLPKGLFQIGFYFKVDHELRITPQAGAKTSVLLEPKGGWENYWANYDEKKRIALHARSSFGISSSGPLTFTAYLKCEQTEGEHCAIRSDKDPSITVPVESSLTLPFYINKKNQEKVKKQLLKVGKDLNHNIFNAINRVEDGIAHIDFKVKRSDVADMIGRGADTYRGTVTVLFDLDL